jgi:hypothetical protein
MCRKCKETTEVVEKWLEVAKTRPDIFSDRYDEESRTSNPAFIANRHDQSVLTFVLSMEPYSKTCCVIDEEIEKVVSEEEYGLRPILAIRNPHTGGYKLQKSTRMIGGRQITITSRKNKLRRKLDIVLSKKSKLKRMLGGSNRKNNHKKEKAFVYTHLGLGDMIVTIGAVRYLATKYNTVTVVCKSVYKDAVQQLYADNPSINFHIVTGDSDMSPWDKQANDYRTKGYDVYSCGQFSLKPSKNRHEFPNGFYDDMDIPRSARTEYFKVPHTDSAKKLYDDFKGRPYIVVHQNASNMSMPIIERLIELGEKRLIIDVNKNRVDKEADSEGYALAERCINIPFIEYVKLFEGADELHMVDSSVFAFAMHLNFTNVKRAVVYPRNNDGTVLDSFGKFEMSFIFAK